MAEPIIDDTSYIDPSWMDGTMARGLVPRDMSAYPVGSFAPPAQMKLIPRSEWSDRIKAMTADKARVSDIRMGGMNGAMIPSLDQNEPNTRPPRWGYCWSYGTTIAVMLRRAAMNQPYVRLSAFGMAYTIKNGKDEGAWGALSLDFAMNRGIPSESVWPNFARKNPGSWSDPVWQDALKYKATDGWSELGDPVYDRDLTFDQMATCLLSGIPVVVDLMWWGHCVCAMDLVETSPGKFGIRIINSWSDRWGENGVGVLSGSKAIPDNAVALTGVLAS
jgi:hypothetical protein